MLLHVVPGQPVCLNSQSPHKLPRQEAPAYRPPKGTRAAKYRCVLASSGSSPHRCPLLVWRPHAVCVDRAAGLVSLSPFHVPAVPLRRSRHPAALWCGRCLALRIHSGSSSSKVCATRTSSTAPLDLSPPGGGSVGFAAARGSRAGERLQNKAGGYPRTPFQRARSLPPPQSPANVISEPRPLFHMQKVRPGGRRPEPRRPLPARSGFATDAAGRRVHRTCGLRRAAHTGVAATRLHGSVSLHHKPGMIVSRRRSRQSQP